MHDVLFVHVIERKAELVDHGGSLTLFKSVLLDNLIKEVASGNKLHDDVIITLVFHELEHTCDVRVHCVFQHGQLILIQLLVNIGDFQALLLDNLDSTWDT